LSGFPGRDPDVEVRLSDARVSSPPTAVASIILSMGLVALGNGLLFAYIPVKLAAEGFAPWVAGAILTALAGGGLAGCLLTGPLVQRVGHARVFASLGAALILSVLGIALDTLPLLWIASRALYGLAMSGLFIVSQSWLNDACENAWRGRVIAIFYMTYVLCIGAGAYLLTYISLDSVAGPLLSIFFAAAAILPVGLTRLRAPPPPESVSVAIRAVWRISPVGLAGLFAVGGLTMLVQGFAPIYAAAEDYAKEDIALLMFLMQFGMIAVQYPLGALSDRMDRRYILILASLIVIASAAVATRTGGASLLWLILVFAVWSGATETIFAVANAHANDRAEPQYYVAVSSTLLVAWSISGVLMPGVATALTEVVGPQAFMYVAMGVAALYAAFVAYRLTRREPAPEAEQEPYQPISAQAPYTVELAPQAAEGPGGEGEA
jgi:MFS family permease